MKKINVFIAIAAILLLALLPACESVPPRPTVNNDLEKIKWGTRAQKSAVITKAYRAKNPAILIQLLNDTAANINKVRVVKDTYYYDNRSELIYTVRFSTTVIAKIGKAEAFDAVLNLAKNSYFKDSDRLSTSLDKALSKIATRSKVNQLIDAAATEGIAPSHSFVFLKSVAQIIKKNKLRISKKLKNLVDKMLNSTDTGIVKSGIAVTGLLNYKEAEKTLLKNINSTSAEIKKASSLALVRMGNKKGVLPLLQLTKYNSDAFNKIAMIVEKAGFASAVRLYKSQQEQKIFEKQTKYLNL